MQYTIRNIPPQLDRQLRDQAKEVGKSLNQIVVETLLRGSGLGDQPVRRRDLSRIAGSWVEDPAVDEALEAQRQIDPDLWQ